MTALLLAVAVALLVGALAATLVGAGRIIADRDDWMVRAWRAEDELERAYRDSGSES